MTMIEIFKDMLSALPIKLKIIKEKELSSKWKLTLEFRECQTTAELSKLCAPNEATNSCWRTVATAMSSLYIKLGDLQKAQLWLDALHDKKLITSDNA